MSKNQRDQKIVYKPNKFNYLNINFLIFNIIYMNIIFLIKFNAINAELKMDRNGCSETKGCLFKPDGCDPQLDCTLGIIFYVSDVNKLNIQLVAHSLLPVPQYQYIAIGFSKDTIMGDDFVIECVFGPLSTAFSDVEVFISYNVRKSNDRTYLNRDEHLKFFENIEGSMVDGRLMCQFTQQIVPQFNIKDRKIWNLNDKYYIIGATGTSQPDEINAHDTTPGSHFYPIVTTRPINPSLIGPKIFKLPLPFVEQSLSTIIINKEQSMSINNNNSYINTKFNANTNKLNISTISNIASSFSSCICNSWNFLFYFVFFYLVLL